MRNAWPLAMLSLVTCTHFARGPASVERTFKERCERAVKNLVEATTLEGGEARAAQTLWAGLERAERELIPRAGELVAKLEHSCSYKRAAASLEIDLRSKREGIFDQRMLIAEFAGELNFLEASAPINDPDFAKNATCIARCDEDDGACARQCGVTVAYIDALARSELLWPVIGECADFEKTEPDSVKTFAKIFGDSRQKIARNARQTIDRSVPIMDRMENLERRLARLEAAAKRPVTATGCAETKPEWYTRVRRAITHMVKGNAHGSGFYARYGTDGARLITAEHVFNPTDGALIMEPQTLDIVRRGFRGRPPRFVPRVFTPKAGLFDRGNDIIQSDVNYGGPVLTVADGAEVPRRGQRFYIAGFPGSTLSIETFAMHACEFEGFDRAWTPKSEQAAYVLKCQGIDGSLEGISGGPMLDEEGRAWGVVVTQISILDRVYVSPISLGPWGEILMGIQKVFVSDDCFTPDMLSHRRCQLMPGAYSTN